MARIAVIDIGTITARLAVSEKEQGSALSRLKKISTICNMGEGTAETGRLSSAAIERVLACVSGYVDEARAMGASACACTLTSAARDAENSSELLEPLAKLGLVPSVIPASS
jgi:exopolyphosphatase / guanosine-5'-triphosphate,3'-diphosphate pyrophosphatase